MPSMALAIGLADHRNEAFVFFGAALNSLQIDSENLKCEQLLLLSSSAFVVVWCHCLSALLM